MVLQVDHLGFLSDAFFVRRSFNNFCFFNLKLLFNLGSLSGGFLKRFLPGLQQLLQKFSLADLESEDLLLILVLYLMYRESGDKELLFILGGMLFL